MRGLFGKHRFRLLVVKIKNRILCRLYPFLVPWNRFTGGTIPNYDYSFTELDALPIGWRKRFGLRMCHEIKDALLRDEDLDRWRIVQLKEKYGVMRLYDNGCRIYSDVQNIERKYEALSAHTCIKCGAEATRITLGWVAPYCDKCCPEEASEPIIL